MTRLAPINSAQVDTYSQATVLTEFSLTFEAPPGEIPVLVGGGEELGDWNVWSGVFLEWTDGDIWRGYREMPAGGEAPQFKFVKVCMDGSVEWEKGPNRKLEIPPGAEILEVCCVWGSDTIDIQGNKLSVLDSVEDLPVAAPELPEPVVPKQPAPEEPRPKKKKSSKARFASMADDSAPGAKAAAPAAQQAKPPPPPPPKPQGEKPPPRQEKKSRFASLASDAKPQPAAPAKAPQPGPAPASQGTAPAKRTSRFASLAGDSKPPVPSDKANKAPPAKEPKREQPKTPKATFRLDFSMHCQMGPKDSLLVVGSAPELGAWDAASALTLVRSEGDLCRGSVDLPVDTRSCDFKLVKSYQDGRLEWQPGENHRLEFPAIDSGAKGYQVSGDWQARTIQLQASKAAPVEPKGAKDAAVPKSSAPGPQASGDLEDQLQEITKRMAKEKAERMAERSRLLMEMTDLNSALELPAAGEKKAASAKKPAEESRESETVNGKNKSEDDDLDALWNTFANELGDLEVKESQKPKQSAKLPEQKKAAEPKIVPSSSAEPARAKPALEPSSLAMIPGTTDEEKKEQAKQWLKVYEAFNKRNRTLSDDKAREVFAASEKDEAMVDLWSAMIIMSKDKKGVECLAVMKEEMESILAQPQVMGTEIVNRAPPKATSDALSRAMSGLNIGSAERSMAALIAELAEVSVKRLEYENAWKTKEFELREAKQLQDHEFRMMQEKRRAESEEKRDELARAQLEMSRMQMEMMKEIMLSVFKRKSP